MRAIHCLIEGSVLSYKLDSQVFGNKQSMSQVQAFRLQRVDAFTGMVAMMLLIG